MSGIAEKEELTLVEKINEAQKLKELGNTLFTSGDYRGALSKYVKISLYISGLQGNEVTNQMKQMLNRPDDPNSKISEKDRALIDSVLVSGYSNIAACYLKLQEYNKVIEFATKALKIDNSNAKVLYRRGIAYHNLRNLDAAMDDLKTANKLAPTDAAIKKEIIAVKEKITVGVEKQKKEFAGIFDKLVAEK